MAQNNPLIKKAYIDDSLTQEQAEEYERCRDDCEYFLENYVRVQHPKKGSVLFKLYKYQKKILKALLNNNMVVAMQPRQSGKSTLVICVLLWETIFHPDVKVGIASNKLSGAKEMIARLQYAYEELPMWMKPGITTYNKTLIEFDNGSSLEGAATTESTFRGKSPTRMYLDEFAFVEPRIAEAFWTSILPALSAGGTDAIRMIITSTPNGSEGKFAEIWHKAETGENDFVTCFVKNEEVPGREGVKFKKKMLKIMTPLKYSQEFDCKFVSDKGTLIHSEVLEAIRTKEPFRTYKGLNVWGKFAGREIGLIADVGAGVGKDYSIIEIFDIHTLEQLAEYRVNDMRTTQFTHKIIEILTFIQNEGAKEIYYTVESNSIGLAVIELLNNSTHTILDEVTFISQPKSKHPGIQTTSKTKMAGCMKLKDLLESEKMKIHSKALLSELKFFVSKGQSFGAEKGMNDDLVMGCVLFANLLQILARFDDQVYENISTLTPIPCVSGEDDVGGNIMPIVF